MIFIQHFTHCISLQEITQCSLSTDNMHNVARKACCICPKYRDDYLPYNRQDTLCKGQQETCKAK